MLDLPRTLGPLPTYPLLPSAPPRRPATTENDFADSSNTNTCKACQTGHFTSCRRQALNATEGIDRVGA